ncbi:unnamed protein product [Bursaphelenchus okinawaensis]|uniref:Uncharacterized protein n=1 Tax=Bursaphelenchus okinawaensis TaxID=465554 RepID=A0A811L788_9BILA|nr:unnamed protein product [Bursaphelenchus okinawaensis]CAG9118136.1 unnamed protein product [Bursaphelenchus okinawaensis]
MWFIFLIISTLLLPTVTSQCNNTGVWAEWQLFGDCAYQSDGTLAKVRYRDCDPLPLGCIATGPYICTGEFTSDETCSEAASATASTKTTVIVMDPTSQTSTVLTTVPTIVDVVTEAATTLATTLLTVTSTTAEATTAALTLPSGSNLATTCTWGDWGSYSSCSDTCGMCGATQRFRQCSSTDCTCDGSAFENVACGSMVCLYPRSSCCSGYSPTSNGTAFVCASTSTTTTTT